MYFQQITDRKLAQYAYLIGCQATGEAILIDPERDIDRYIDIAAGEGLEIVAVADTHIHADYLTGMREFAEKGTKVYASDEGDKDWKYEWLIGSEYNYQLIKDKDSFRIGNIKFDVLYSPGHTPEHVSYLITDLGGGADAPMGIASGDFVFVGDLGRPDLLESAAGIAGMMEPSARTLFRSVQRFLDLEDFMQLWPGHGAGSACGKALGAIPESTVGYEKRFNASIQAAFRGEDEFVKAILDGQPEPPMYFARMKMQNKVGPALLGQLPDPGKMTVQEIVTRTEQAKAVVIDTRLDRSEFMAGHIRGSLYSPFEKPFNTVAGCYVDDQSDIYLIIDSEHIGEAVRDLIRIGLDRIVGYATPKELSEFLASGGTCSSIEHTSIRHIDQIQARGDVTVLDVRGASEFEASHIHGAVNIAHTRLAPRAEDIPDNTVLAVHCRSGTRSAVAAAYLKYCGHDVIYVDGDFDDWTASKSTDHAVSRRPLIDP